MSKLQQKYDRQQSGAGAAKPHVNLVQSRRRGRAFGGLAHQTKLQAPQTETWNTINQLGVCQLLSCQAPPHKRKVPLLKTFWWRFWLDDFHLLIVMTFISLSLSVAAFLLRHFVNLKLALRLSKRKEHLVQKQ